MPMSTTTVPPRSASALARWSSSGTCPEMIVTTWLTPRWVTGMPAAPGTPTADDTPGTTVTGTPAPDGGSDLLATPAEDVGVPALEPHDGEPGEGPLDHDPLDLPLGHRVVPGQLAHVDDLRPGSQRCDVSHLGQAVGEHDVGVRERPQPVDGEQPRAAGPGTDEDHAAPRRVRGGFLDDQRRSGERAAGLRPLPRVARRAPRVRAHSARTGVTPVGESTAMTWAPARR